MRLIIAYILVFSGLCIPVYAQSLTESNLPIVIIQSDSYIQDEVRVGASLKIIYRGPGQTNYMSDLSNPLFLNYNGRIDIEIRGSSSASTDKKQYGFSTKLNDNVTNNNVSLLGMPSENDWILNGMAFDPALIRDYLCYNLSRQIGEYASRTAYCELVINGAYMGLYLLQEKIKPDDDRVDIVRVETPDNALPALTGGYITKADKTTGGDPVAFSINSRYDDPVYYIHDWPKPENITIAQSNYIFSQFQLLQSRIYGGNNEVVARGYPAVIDVRSFIDYMLISELSSNADAYMYSTFFHKDRNGKLRAGPVWDGDLTFGNDLFHWGYDRSKPDIWQFSNYDNEGSKFWYDLYNNRQFHCHLLKRWDELTADGAPLNIASLESYIDQTVAYISAGVSRNITRWYNTSDYQGEISDIKAFIRTRYSWISVNLGNYNFCDFTPLPPLVITKIMYHPSVSAEFPESDEQEFIEITNTGDDAVNLTGIYFGGTGLTYQFPENAVLNGKSSLMLAANATVFSNRYNCLPFGEFTRHLSNKSQLLMLADAFGNVIDSVRYYDTIPWPEADGNGFYIKLKEAGADNDSAQNWIASNDIFVSENEYSGEPDLILYPNPVRNGFSVSYGSAISRVIITDIQGRTVLLKEADGNVCEIDLSACGSGTYIVKIVTPQQAFIRKIVKE